MAIAISKSTTINVSADQLWSILGDDFANVGQWARAVDSSAVNLEAPAIEGADIGGRVCQAPGFGSINETFTSFDPEERSYAFVATASKIPSFVRNITNHTKITPIGPNTSKLEVAITADTDGLRGAMVKPIMTRKFGAAIDGLFEDVAVYAETGKVSDGKTKALVKAGR